jgi:hypothetical protein
MLPCRISLSFFVSFLKFNFTLNTYLYISNFRAYTK